MVAATALAGALVAASDNGAIRLVQWCVIAFIFLFFLRVVRAVWVEVRPGRVPAPAERAIRAWADAPDPASARRGRKGALVVQVIAPPEQATRRYEIDGAATIGRSPGSTIPTTYDVYSSTEHARLFREGGRLYVEDLESTNGTFVNSERIDAPTRLERGDQVQIGETLFEVTR